MTNIDRFFLGFFASLVILMGGYYVHQSATRFDIVFDQKAQCLLGADRLAIWEVCEKFKPSHRGKNTINDAPELGLKFNPGSPLPIGGGFGLI